MQPLHCTAAATTAAAATATGGTCSVYPVQAVPYTPMWTVLTLLPDLTRPSPPYLLLS